MIRTRRYIHVPTQPPRRFILRLFSRSLLLLLFLFLSQSLYYYIHTPASSCLYAAQRFIISNTLHVSLITRRTRFKTASDTADTACFNYVHLYIVPVFYLAVGNVIHTTKMSIYVCSAQVVYIMDK